MKYKILLTCSLFIFFSNTAFSAVICTLEGAGASFGDCPDGKMTRDELYNKMIRLYNKGRGAEADSIAREHNLTKELYDHHLVSLLNRRKPNEAKKFAEQNNLVERYNSLLPEYNAMVKRDIAQQRRRQQIAEQHERKLAAMRSMDSDLGLDPQQNKYKYQGRTGQQYKYDLSKYNDRLRYNMDPLSKLKDRYNPDYKIQMDRQNSQYGGGAE